jgi:murein L,D-transpeptidase YcbB/YkuD
MNKKDLSYPIPAIILLLVLAIACTNHKKPAPPVSVIAKTPEEMEKKATDIIRESLEFAASSQNDIGDSVFLFNIALVQKVYNTNQFNLVWSDAEQWTWQGDSLLQFIRDAKLYGLFPEDYHYTSLNTLRLRFQSDSIGKTFRRDAALWSKADLMLTDAFMHIVSDIKLGRLPNDSITLRADSVLQEDFYIHQFDSLQKGAALLSDLMAALEPHHEGYQSLKAGIRQFLDSADYRTFTFVPFPGKNPTDSFKTILQKRLFEGGYIAYDSVRADSAQLSDAVKRFQKQKNITIDGKAGDGTVRMLNLSDQERFIRIAISMDRYKLLPEQMPERYIWVNLPSFYMKLQDGDSVKLVSKVICGKPLTRTPLLTSAISEIITYPQWTVPTSIIVKEILPAIKKNPEYLARKGFSLLDKNGDEVDPYTVDWSKYSKGIPYRVVQGSGDANALGILKFNFPNKYAVYLHDTNQRYLFGQTIRSLSHGCVRVQEWQKLAYYIIRNDRVQPATNKLAMIDSMDTWIERKEKHSIPVKSKLPVYIRYFTCEGKPGGITFYDDIYGEDKRLRERYFALK